MTKFKLIEIIEKMIQDKNYMINSGKGNAQQTFAWEYAREDLQNVLKCVKELEN